MSKKINDTKNIENENITEQEPKAEETAVQAEPPETVSKEEYDGLTAELNDYKDKYLRLAAEFDNFRKRTSRERETVFRDAVACTINEFLPVYDNLLRALENPTTDKAYKKGIELIYNELCEMLKKLNVSEIDPIEEKFDPNLHNAVMHVEDETVGESVVVQVLQKGFKIDDKVIRYAMVKVAN